MIQPKRAKATTLIAGLLISVAACGGQAEFDSQAWKAASEETCNIVGSSYDTTLDSPSRQSQLGLLRPILTEGLGRAEIIALLGQEDWNPTEDKWLTYCLGTSMIDYLYLEIELGEDDKLVSHRTAQT